MRQRFSLRSDARTRLPPRLILMRDCVSTPSRVTRDPRVPLGETLASAGASASATHAPAHAPWSGAAATCHFMMVTMIMM